MKLFIFVLTMIVSHAWAEFTPSAYLPQSNYDFFLHMQKAVTITKNNDYISCLATSKSMCKKTNQRCKDALAQAIISLWSINEIISFIKPHLLEVISQSYLIHMTDPYLQDEEHRKKFHYINGVLQTFIDLGNEGTHEITLASQQIENYLGILRN